MALRSSRIAPRPGAVPPSGGAASSSLRGTLRAPLGMSPSSRLGRFPSWLWHCRPRGSHRGQEPSPVAGALRHPCAGPSGPTRDEPCGLDGPSGPHSGRPPWTRYGAATACRRVARVRGRGGPGTRRRRRRASCRRSSRGARPRRGGACGAGSRPVRAARPARRPASVSRRRGAAGPRRAADQAEPQVAVQQQHGQQDDGRETEQTDQGHRRSGSHTTGPVSQLRARQPVKRRPPRPAAPGWLRCRRCASRSDTAVGRRSRWRGWAVGSLLRTTGAERGFPLVPALSFTPHAAATAVLPLAGAAGPVVRRRSSAGSGAALAGAVLARRPRPPGLAATAPGCAWRR